MPKRQKVVPGSGTEPCEDCPPKNIADDVNPDAVDNDNRIPLDLDADRYVIDRLWEQAECP